MDHPIICGHCGAENLDASKFCTQCGESLILDGSTGEPVQHAGAGGEMANDGISTLIPYRNGAALAAYYCGVFSLIPCLGLLLGPVAFVLGIMGLKAAARNPGAKGRVHAWVGIVLGLLVLLGHLALIGLLFSGKI